jgi:type II restriction/modification system DNA methylase subunit YeeA
MSEFSSINIALGIIGTVTGAIALFISFWTLRKEKPRLKIRILNLEHDFAVSHSQIKTISFWVMFQIRNLGDRGTSINDTELAFIDDGKQHSLKKEYWKGYAHESERRNWINAHETKEMKDDLYGRFDGNEKERMDCVFTIYHTHGALHVDAVSERRKQ